jgi:uncharacterized protein
MEIRKVAFKSDKLNIYGELYIPEERKTPMPALVLCHGMPAAKYDPQERGWAVTAERFCSEGFISLIYNSRGAGLSEGNFDMAGWANDLTEAVNFLYSLGEIDKRKVFLLGSSAGAATCVYIGAQDKRAAGVVTWACPGHFSFVKDNLAAATIQHFRQIGIIKDANFPPSVEKWAEDFDKLGAINWIDKISPRPLLMIHGDADDVVPPEHAKILFAKAKEPKELMIIPGAGHRLRLDDRAVGKAVSWLKQQAGI